MLRQRENRPEEEVLRLLDQRDDTGDLRIAKALHDIGADLLRIRARSLPAVARLQLRQLHQRAHVHAVLLRVVVAGQQHAAAREVDGRALEVHGEIGLDGREAEGVAEPRVARFALRVDVLEARDGVDSVAAHEQVAVGGAAVFEGDGDVFGGLFDVHRALAAGQGDVLVLPHGGEDAFEGVAAGDAEGFVGRVADAFAFGAAEVGGCEACGVDVEDFEVVDCAAIVSFADDGKGPQVVEKSQGIGSEVDGAADGRRYRADLEDLDSGDLSFRCVFGESECSGQARDAATQNDDVQAVWRSGSHDCLLIARIEREKEKGNRTVIVRLPMGCVL